MQAEDKFALTSVSIDMANLVPDIISIDVAKDESRNEYGVWAKYLDGDTIPSQLLSDGTLQLLVLATLGNDPQFHGLLVSKNQKMVFILRTLSGLRAC